jgi:hypothetical protein
VSPCELPTPSMLLVLWTQGILPKSVIYFSSCNLLQV